MLPNLFGLLGKRLSLGLPHRGCNFDRAETAFWGCAFYSSSLNSIVEMKDRFILTPVRGRLVRVLRDVNERLPTLSAGELPIRLPSDWSAVVV